MDIDDILTLEGSQKSRVKSWKKSKAKIRITNYEALLMDDLYDEMRAWDIEWIAFDESHKLKSLKSKRTKHAIALAEKVPHKYLLSGTPTTNSLEDFFSQLLILDGGQSLGTKLRDFQTEYFTDLNAGMPRHCYFPNRVPKHDAEDRIAKAIAPISMTISKEECLDLPPLVRQRIDVELSPEQRRVYAELEKECVAEISEGKYCVTDMELTKALRLQQIVAGFVKDTEGKYTTFTENPRLTALEETLENIGDEQIIIWTIWRENYQQIRELLTKLGRKHCEITGGVPMKLRDNIVRDFNSGEKRVLLTHPKAAGIGVNLTAASYAIFYARSYSWEDDDQAEARNHRGGSERHQKITRIDIIAPGTIEEPILEALQKKANVSAAVLNYLKGTNG